MKSLSKQTEILNRNQSLNGTSSPVIPVHSNKPKTLRADMHDRTDSCVSFPSNAKKFPWCSTEMDAIVQAEAGV